MNQRRKIIVRSLGNSDVTLEESDAIIEKVIKTILKNGGRKVRNNIYEIKDITPAIKRFSDLKYR
ncbi:MAG: hypothetical protein V8R30_04980 [Clostridia bacterium]|jgi:hypothetical protein|nr:hypothetical protein [Clostridia bacterium]